MDILQCCQQQGLDGVNILHHQSPDGALTLPPRIHGSGDIFGAAKSFMMYYSPTGQQYRTVDLKDGLGLPQPVTTDGRVQAPRPVYDVMMEALEDWAKRHGLTTHPLAHPTQMKPADTSFLGTMLGLLAKHAATCGVVARWTSPKWQAPKSFNDRPILPLLNGQQVGALMTINRRFPWQLRHVGDVCNIDGTYVLRRRHISGPHTAAHPSGTTYSTGITQAPAACRALAKAGHGYGQLRRYTTVWPRAQGGAANLAELAGQTQLCHRSTDGSGHTPRCFQYPAYDLQLVRKPEGVRYLVGTAATTLARPDAMGTRLQLHAYSEHLLAAADAHDHGARLDGLPLR
ncbi:hypothetical protein H257_08134 [Aphanomyces astaci]|uniref:Uncharacterized protein n=1 Tax=Aphanomyces astaci TaxID=112090 RepID=W4GI87_APHAT|nr:hypothetical protein H257_08134 [Aphanomyces astaci]ETV78643.1 hypothetical protein H257_08134 [Aphanomyces astaci]|eukprot:XP_009832224.1 hypothetical protein H257_08134 [Aphanomyces astaci]